MRSTVEGALHVSIRLTRKVGWEVRRAVNSAVAPDDGLLILNIQSEVKVIEYMFLH